MRKQFFAAVEGSKERDEGYPTSGAWGGSVERCLSSGSAAVRDWGALEKRLWVAPRNRLKTKDSFERDCISTGEAAAKRSLESCAVRTPRPTRSTSAAETAPPFSISPTGWTTNNLTLLSALDFSRELASRRKITRD